MNYRLILDDARETLYESEYDMLIGARAVRRTINYLGYREIYITLEVKVKGKWVDWWDAG